MPQSLPPEQARRISTPLGRLASWLSSEAMEEIRLLGEVRDDAARGVRASQQTEGQRSQRVSEVAASIAVLASALKRGDLDDPFAGWQVVQRTARSLGARYERMLDGLSDHEKAQLSGLGVSGSLALNRAFAETLMVAGAPALALGVAEDGGARVAAFALQLDGSLPPEIAGCRFSPSVARDEAGRVVGLELEFEFPQFAKYHVLVNPSSLLARACLRALVESGRCLMLVITRQGRVGAFMVGGKDAHLIGVASIWPEISATRIAQRDFERAEFRFGQRRVDGSLMNWVCRDDPRFLDPSQARLPLRFSGAPVA